MPPRPARTTSLYREPVLEEILRRLAPAAAPDLTGAGALVVLALAAVLVGWWPAWRVLRLVVTLVHELGHAVVAVLSGRRFTGFVLRSDMSGHAVTVGPARGPGAVATAWAGYPAPALLGALAVWVSARGWAAPLLGLLLLGLLVSLVRVRSGLTALVVLTSGAGLAALWWWRDDALQQQVLLGAGVVLLVGAWRHLGAVLSRPSPGSDPDELARLTGVPAGLWLAGFVLVLAAASWLVVAEVLALL